MKTERLPNLTKVCDIVKLFQIEYLMMVVTITYLWIAPKDPKSLISERFENHRKLRMDKKSCN